ncbi:MAG: SLBB domain-containing protein, partial [Gammaproteobacteria bacterium]|nr:SLBB domain-containing protein [Gammaproteobacteria bacterium]
IKRQLIGVEAFITMGELRSIQVFVLGEVEQPGSYSVSALATMTHALMYGRGIKEIGSLRNIALKRKGKVIGKLDLYKLLLEGNTSKDLRLQPGDVIHVPAKKDAVTLLGAVARPAVYELNKEKSLSELLSLAGGVSADAELDNIRIDRVVKNENKLLTIDYRTTFGKKFEVQNGDIIHLNEVLERQDNIIQLKGEVLKPGRYTWIPGIRISHIIKSLRDLKPNADPEYILITRYDPNSYKITVHSLSLRKALTKPDSKDNMELQPLDEILVVSHDNERTLQIQPVLDAITLQTDTEKSLPIVKIRGQVKGPGTYPLEKNMRVSDLIVASGRLTEAAYILEAELTRFDTSTDNIRKIQHINVELSQILDGNKEKDILLQPHDLLNIKEIPLWREEETVTLYGEVQFPGKYAIRRGESLQQLLQRAGGLTQFAYPEGAVFIRDDLRKREQERLDTMTKNLEAELAALTLAQASDPSQVSDLGAANGLLEQIRGSKAAGRLVIDLKSIVDPEIKTKPIILRGGDELFVPSHMQEVSVIGQVYHPTSHLHKEGQTVEDYLNLSGGLTKRADKENIYVIRANGEVRSAENGWGSDEVEVMPGDTVVAPLDADRMSQLKLWSSISQIVYQLGLSAAAWNTVGLFK